MVERLVKLRANTDEIFSANIFVICLKSISHRINCFNKETQLRLLLVVLRDVFISCWFKKKNERNWENFSSSPRAFPRAFHFIWEFSCRVSSFHFSWMKVSCSTKLMFHIQLSRLCCLSPAVEWVRQKKITTKNLFELWSRQKIIFSIFLKPLREKQWKHLFWICDRRKNYFLKLMNKKYINSSSVYL